mgnify:CR=1 FL=1
MFYLTQQHYGIYKMVKLQHIVNGSDIFYTMIHLPVGIQDLH